MRFELDLISKVDGPLQDPIDRPTKQEQRKALRERTDIAIHEALLANDLTALADRLCDTMLVSASILRFNETEPTVENFVEATRELIQVARKVADQALISSDKDALNRAMVMIELTVRGAFAALSVPYEQSMSLAANGQSTRDLLVALGKVQSNEEGEHGSDEQNATTA